MLINKKDQDAIRSHFDNLTGKVRLVMFEASLDCSYCPQTKQLIEELSGLSDKLSAEFYNFHTDDEMVKKFGIDKIPAIVLLDDSDKDYGIRFYGIPSGYEFATLIEDILMVSTGKTSLSAKTVDVLQNLQKPVHLQVFVTPT